MILPVMSTTENDLKNSNLDEKLKRWPLQCQCSALPVELSGKLGAGHHLIVVGGLDCRFQGMPIFNTDIFQFVMILRIFMGHI